jgi:hypothetical protein
MLQPQAVHQARAELHHLHLSIAAYVQARAFLEQQRLGLASQAGEFRLDESGLTLRSKAQPAAAAGPAWAEDGEGHSDDDFDAAGSGRGKQRVSMAPMPPVLCLPTFGFGMHTFQRSLIGDARRL